MRKKKVLLVLTYYRPFWTGLTQYAARVAEGLVERGYEMGVICGQHEKKLKRNEKIKRVEVTRIPYLIKMSRSLVLPSFPWEFYKKIKDYDVVVVYLPFQQIIPAVLITKLLGKKLFLVHNGDLVMPKEGGVVARLMERIYYLTTDLAVILADKIIIHTKDYANHSGSLSKFKNKWAVCMPPVKIPSIENFAVIKFKKKYGLPKKKLIGFAGRFVEEKGVDYLVRAISLITKKRKDIHFVFAGDYKIPYENFWQRIAPLIEENKKNISLLGLLDDKREIFVFYKAMDIFVVPSRTDCFPFSQVEAMLSGLPSVCTNIPGARWLVKNTGLGLLVKPRSYKALAEGLLKVVSNKGRYQTNKQVREMKRIYNYERLIDRFEEVFGLKEA